MQCAMCNGQLLTFSLYCIKQIDFMLSCICSTSDHRRRQNVVRASVTHSPNASCANFFVLTTFRRHLWSIAEKVHDNMDLFFPILNSAIIVTKKKYKKEENKDYYFRRGKRGKVQMSTRMCQGTTCIFLQEQKKMQGENVIAVITTNRNRLKKNLMTQSTKVLPFKRFKRQGILSLKKG